MRATMLFSAMAFMLIGTIGMLLSVGSKTTKQRWIMQGIALSILATGYLLFTFFV
jgi:hypothetical protein